MATILFRATLSLALLLATNSVRAEPEPLSVTVRFGDLDLATRDGQRTLHHRIADAVTLVCGDTDSRDLAVIAPIRACRTRARNDVMPRIEQAIAAARGAGSANVAAARDARPAS